MSDNILSIYVICAGPSAKVGISVRPKQRLADLQCANPHEVLTLVFVAKGDTTAIRKAERICHARLADKRLRNEWFSVSGDVAREAVIDSVNEAYGIS